MPEQDCQSWRETWLAGPGDEPGAAAHLARCADCRAFVADIRRIDQGLERLPLVLPSPPRWAQWEGGVFARLAGARRTAARSWRAPLQVAAAVALFALALAYAQRPAHDESADIYVRILDLERQGQSTQARALRERLAARYPGSVAARLAAHAPAQNRPMIDPWPRLAPNIVAHYREAEDIIVREHIALATLPADQRRLMAAEIYLVLKGDPARARALYEGLLSEFPHSRYAAVARRQLDALRMP